MSKSGSSIEKKRFLAMSFGAVSCLLLSGCNSTETPDVEKLLSNNAVVSEKGILAFRDVCLKSAPSFSEAFIYAKKYGISQINDISGKKTGLGDPDLLLEVIPNQRCAVHTDLRKGVGVVSEFTTVVSKATGSKDLISPIITDYKGGSYIFYHNRNNYETYYMLKRGS